MDIGRRQFLERAGVLAAAASTITCSGSAEPDSRSRARRIDNGGDDPEWQAVRQRFAVDPGWIHLAGLLIATHPRSVGDSIDEHRRALNENPAVFLERNMSDNEAAVRRAAASYLGCRADDIALTDSTSMGLGLVYNGIAIRDDQEMLSTTHDYYVTHRSLEYKAGRTGAAVRFIEPFSDSASATADEVIDRITREVRPETRVLALTWVHSWSGIRIPVRGIADRLDEINADRDDDDRVLLCLDGAHGLGAVDEDVTDLGCDFLMAGTHKWLLGPRGTGIVWGRPATQHMVSPTIPTFSDESIWGGRMTPGGFKPFEHQWAVADAFALHEEIGRDRVAERIAALATQCKEGLAEMGHVTLRTPTDPELSAGIVSFDVAGHGGYDVVHALRNRQIATSAAPYPVPYARFTPGLLNTHAEIDLALEAVRDLA